MVQVLLYKAVRFVLRFLPISWSIRLAKMVFGVGYWTRLQKRKNVLENLAVVCGSDVRDGAKEIFSSFGRYLVEFLNPVSKREKMRMSAERFGVEHLTRAYQKGKGVIAVTAHLGNWEMAAYATVKLGFPVSAVFFTHPNPGVDRLFMEQRQVEGLSVIPWRQDATRRCLEALRKGQVLAIAGDIDFPGTGIEVEMFGRKTKISRGPIVFSRRTGASIVPGGYVWGNSSGQLFFDELIEPASCTEEELAKQVARALEKMIRGHPTQWFCFEKMWRE